jgi:hypothetical protein
MLEGLELTLEHFLKTKSIIWGESDTNKSVVDFRSR